MSGSDSCDEAPRQVKRKSESTPNDLKKKVKNRDSSSNSTPIISSPIYSEKSYKEAPEDYLAENFGYRFDNHLKLKNIKTGEGFKFTTQSEYEKLGKVVKSVIQWRMVNEYGLIRKQIPIEGDGPKSYIYMTPGVLETSREKLLLLVQGAGAVRPGIWARSVCINESLEMGSMLPFLKFAQEQNMEVIIFNPNKRTDHKKLIPRISSLEHHSQYVWSTFVSPSPMSEIYIVAHSCGGPSTMHLVNSFWDEFKSKVVGIGFTDTVHGYSNLSKEKLKFLKHKAVDWVASSKPLDTFIKSSARPIVYLSSGHHKHEYTTGSSQYSIMSYLQECKSSNKYLDQLKINKTKKKSSCLIN